MFHRDPAEHTDIGIHQHASGVDSTGKAAVAAIPNLSNSSSDVQTAIVFGVRHRF